MSSTLYLLIDDAWPQAHRDCCWWLCDPSGREISRGRGDPASWPGIATPDQQLDCILLLHGLDLNCHAARLPVKAKACTQAVIAAALEDELLAPPETLAFVAYPGSGDTARAVASLPLARLASLRQRLEELGLSPQAAWPLGFLVPPGHAALAGENLILRLPEEKDAETGAEAIPGMFISLPADASLDACLDALGSRNTGDGPLPLQIFPDAAPHALEALHPSPHLHASEWPGLPAALPAGPGFLVGELAPPPRYKAGLAHWRSALRLLAGFATGALLLLAGQTTWLSWEARQLRQQITSDFRRIEAQAALVDPVLQARRRIDALRQQSGQLTDQDFLALLAALPVDNELRAGVRSLRYANGQLDIEAKLSEAQREAIRSSSDALGLKDSLAGNTLTLAVEQAR